MTPRSLCAEGRHRQTVDLLYGDVQLILYGSAVTVRTEKEMVKERRFSAGRVIMTQGLMLTKKTRRQVRTEEQDRERFLYLYSKNRPTVVMRENGLQYVSLGKALQVSQAANFNHVVSELRRQIPDAVFDDRLLTRGGQTRILGPLLTPEKHLDVAAALLVKALPMAS
ncbi:MAG: hypothetical protein GXP58_08045 [Deltaproteobacteria bacterium]|nr:hypothetical protein [Deltaproteobacteria bacterium]